MIPRLRMFAGPNGSGKTTLATWLSTDYAVNLYHYVNADILYAEVSRYHQTACPFDCENDDLTSFVISSTYPDAEKQHFLSNHIRIENEMVLFTPSAINSYTVAILANFYKTVYLQKQTSFSFETVFSHSSKLEILKLAKQKNFRTYMYFIATEEPSINLERVLARVQKGGHNVPHDKIIGRYSRCLDNASQAIPFLHRAFFFDNSHSQIQFFAELHEGKWQLYSSNPPVWFVKYFLK